jgi:N-acetylneuraminic acid mutarotase
VLADKIYVAGGFTRDGQPSRVVESFDGNAWSESVALPAPLHHTGLAAAGSRLYVVGGYTARGAASADVWSWAPGEDHWRRGPDMPTARGGLAAAALGARLVVVGGEQPSGTFGQVETYDEPTSKWIGGPSLPTPRHGLGAASLGDRVYVVGGGPTPGLSVSPANEFLRAA